VSGSSAHEQVRMTLERRDFAIAGAIALAFAIPLIAHPGLPAYRHDWSWPPDAQSMRFYVQRAWTSWSSDGLGGPNIFPSALPHFALLWLLAPLVPAKGLLIGSLLVAWTVGILSVAHALRTFFATPRWIALAMGTVYMAAPLVLTKMVAGHVAYVEAYAAFAAFAASLFSIQTFAHPWRWVARAALAGAFTLVQLQFIGFDALLLIALSAAAVVPVRYAAAVAASIVVASLPAFAGPLFIAGAGSATLAMQRAVLSWEQIQSIGPLAALEGRGYFTFYAENLIPSQALWAHVLLVLPIAAVAGAVMLRRRNVAVALVLIGVLSWLACTGLKGPAAPLVRMLFMRFSDMSLYREVYDALAPYCLAVVLLAGVAFSRMWRPVSIGAIVLLLATLAAGWAGFPRLVKTASTQFLTQLVTPARGPGRVVWWPAAQPIGPRHDEDTSGADPLAFTPLGTLQPLFEYEPYGLFASALYHQMQGNAEAAQAELCSVGVRQIVDRANVISHVSGRAMPALALRSSARSHLISQGPDFRQFAIDGDCGLFGFQQGDGNLASLGVALPRSLVHDAPVSGDVVAAFPYYWRYAPIGSCGDGAVLGDARSLLRLPYSWLLAQRASASGPCSWIPKQQLRRERSDALFVASAGAARGPDIALHRASAVRGLVSVEEWAPDHISGKYETPTDSRLLFRTTFDPRWNLTVDGRISSSSIANDFSNSWTVPRGNHRFALEFTPRRPLQGVLALAALALLVLIVASLPRGGVAAQKP